MTPKKRKLLDWVINFQKKNRYSPSIPEIAHRFKITVPTAHQHLVELEGMDLISRKHQQKRFIEIL